MPETRQLALISFDGVNLLLPQTGVATIETIDNIDPAAPMAGTVGTLKAAGGEWPVYALASNFELRGETPKSYKYCVAVNIGNEPAFAILCEEVGTVSVTDDKELQPLQACMRSAESPIDSLMLKDNRLMLLSDLDAMHHYLAPEEAAA